MYGEWCVVKEASAEDYGVQVKTCSRCQKSVYEAIPKIASEVEPTPAPVVMASLFGEGSILAIVLCATAMIVEGVAFYVYMRVKKKNSRADEA